jgi:hypothetical protein
MAMVTAFEKLRADAKTALSAISTSRARRTLLQKKRLTSSRVCSYSISPSSQINFFTALTKSMFAVHIPNPFTASSRSDARDRKVIKAHRQEREQRDITRKAAWDSAVRAGGVSRSLNSASNGATKSTLDDRAKYQFMVDSEDEEMENEIECNLGMSL